VRRTQYPKELTAKASRVVEFPPRNFQKSLQVTNTTIKSTLSLVSFATRERKDAEDTHLVAENR
jgi:hypothetical protein